MLVKEWGKQDRAEEEAKQGYEFQPGLTESKHRLIPQGTLECKAFLAHLGLPQPEAFLSTILHHW